MGMFGSPPPRHPRDAVSSVSYLFIAPFKTSLRDPDGVCVSFRLLLLRRKHVDVREIGTKRRWDDTEDTQHDDVEGGRVRRKVHLHRHGPACGGRLGKPEREVKSGEVFAEKSVFETQLNGGTQQNSHDMSNNSDIVLQGVPLSHLATINSNQNCLEHKTLHP